MKQTPILGNSGTTTLSDDAQPPVAAAAAAEVASDSDCCGEWDLVDMSGAEEDGGGDAANDEEEEEEEENKYVVERGGAFVVATSSEEEDYKEEEEDTAEVENVTADDAASSSDGDNAASSSDDDNAASSSDDEGSGDDNTTASPSSTLPEPPAAAVQGESPLPTMVVTPSPPIELPPPTRLPPASYTASLPTPMAAEATLPAAATWHQRVFDECARHSPRVPSGLMWGVVSSFTLPSARYNTTAVSMQSLPRQSIAAMDMLRRFSDLTLPTQKQLVLLAARCSVTNMEPTTTPHEYEALVLFCQEALPSLIDVGAALSMGKYGVSSGEWHEGRRQKFSWRGGPPHRRCAYNNQARREEEEENGGCLQCAFAAKQLCLRVAGRVSAWKDGVVKSFQQQRAHVS